MNNGSFEGTYTERGYPEVRVAPEWKPFYCLALPPEGDDMCARPEYKPVFERDFPYRVTDGNMAQCWFVRWKVMDAGVYQRITGLPANTKFTFSADVQAWCSQGGDPRVSDGELYFRLGLSLDGTTDPDSPIVIWTDWKRGSTDYQTMSISAITLTPNVTVFVRAWNKWCLSHNDAYIDNAKLDFDSSAPDDPRLWLISADNLERWAKEIRQALPTKTSFWERTVAWLTR